MVHPGYIAYAALLYSLTKTNVGLRTVSRLARLVQFPLFQPIHLYSSLPIMGSPARVSTLYVVSEYFSLFSLTLLTLRTKDGTIAMILRLSVNSCTSTEDFHSETTSVCI